MTDPRQAPPADAALLRLIGNPAACSCMHDDGKGYETDITLDEAARLRALAAVLERLKNGHVDTVESIIPAIERGDIPFVQSEANAYREACAILRALEPSRTEIPQWLTPRETGAKCES